VYTHEKRCRFTSTGWNSKRELSIHVLGAFPPVFNLSFGKNNDMELKHVKKQVSLKKVNEFFENVASTIQFGIFLLPVSYVKFKDLNITLPVLCRL